MRNLLQHVSKTSAYETRSIARIAPRLEKLQVSPITSQFICVQCRFRTSTANSKSQRLGPDLEQSWLLRQGRTFSSRSSLRKDEKPEGISLAPQAPKLTILDSIETDDVPLPPRTERPKVHAVPDEDLPSYRERMRSRLGKRFNELMDDLMPKLALASQRINTYTGTDYSGIAALRKEIIEQEQLVKSRYAAVKEAKELLEIARAKESSSRKEVVRLLERKHAWSDSDLEQYMGLIRSEHANDQAVVAAKEEVAAMDRELEEARTRLENRERKQYHEEQIWSDTIRRNSTWITFVLMGFNILLLLSTTALIEPWRRKRMVKEIKAALEEQNLLRAEPASVAIEEEIDEVIEPTGVSLESIQELSTSAATENGSATPTLVDEVKTDETPLPTAQEPAAELPSDNTTKPTLLDQGKNNADRFKRHIQDLFSEKPVTVRKVDVTAVALEGAAVGAAFVGLLIVLLKPR